MFNIGIWLIILGGGSFLLNYLGYEFKLLAWVDQWGSGTGTLIRVGCIVIGLLLCAASALSSRKSPS